MRAALDDATRQQASERICRHIAAWAIFKRANPIAIYLPMRYEVDLTPLFSSHPEKKWVVPRIQPGGLMTFHAYDSGKVVRHAFGMLEPDPGCQSVPAQDIELVLVPGLAFDREGWRLGYGGGFYDRFLSETQGFSTGVTYQIMVQPHIPHLSHDIPMQFLVTERGIQKVGAATH